MTDRVRWVLGPDHETETVRWIFAEYVNTKSTIKDIVRTLNTKNVTSHRGEQMTQYMVRNLLSCEVVTGIFSWGTRTHRRSATNITKMSEPVRNSKMVLPLIDLETWNRAQAKLKQTALVYRNGLDRTTMLEQLRKALKRLPFLSRSDFGPNGLAHAATYRKYFGSLTEAIRLAQRLPAGTDIGSNPSIRVNKRFFFRDLYQTLVSCGVPVEPRPHQNLLVISGTAVRTRSAETRRDRSGSTYWLVRHCLCEALGERPWLLVLRGDESPIATHYYLLSPEEQTTFNGNIGSNVSGQESLYAARRPTELIGHLRSLASS